VDAAARLPPYVKRLSCRPPARADVHPTTQLSIAGVAGQLQPVVRGLCWIRDTETSANLASKIILNFSVSGDGFNFTGRWIGLQGMRTPFPLQATTVAA